MIIDPFRFAKKGEQLEKVLSLTSDGRLQGVITGKSDVTLTLEGGRFENKRLMLKGNIKGSISVQCQVCLHNMQMPVNIDFKLFPVSSEQQAESLQEEFEPIVIEDNSLALIELVTNELILSMPVAVSHIEIDGRDCVDKDIFSSGSPVLDTKEETKISPFAVLKSIKQKSS